MNDPRSRLIAGNLRVTLQRIAVLDAIDRLKCHPTAEKITAFIHKRYPSIAAGTVYKVLETLVEKKLIIRVTTEKNVMRYDANTELHHHLYCSDSGRIEDYYDEELNEILNQHFSKRKISGFRIKKIKVEIQGSFN